MELLEKSPLERESSCPISNICGGCSYQTLPYDAELMIKRKQIQDLFDGAGFSHIGINILASPRPNRYRNKMEYSFGDAWKGGPLQLGLHRPGHYYEIVPTPDCNIVPGDYNCIRTYVEDFCRDGGFSYFHKQTKEGYLRHLVVRSSHSRKQIMVNLVTTSQAGFCEEDWSAFISGLLALELEGSLISIYHTTNDSLADAVIPEKIDLLWGSDSFRETLNGLDFEVGPFSFFQPNVYTAEKIYDTAIEYAGFLVGKTVYDLYCGTGTITQLLAKRSTHVFGVEINAEAVEKAWQSAKNNGLDNISFVANDVLDELDKLKESGQSPDVLVIDPPRGGIHPKALEKMIEAAPERIVYVSCNPRTMVEDLKVLSAGGYRLEKARAVDQFPRTRHVEALVLMTRE